MDGYKEIIREDGRSEWIIDNLDEVLEKAKLNINTTEGPIISKEEAAAYEAAQYQRDRIYPSAGEQSDMQYWDAINGTTIWLDTITAIKAKFPKGE